MADSEEDENWPEFFENNRLIPVHPNRRRSGSQQKPNIPFRLFFKSLVGISLPQTVVSIVVKVFLPIQTVDYSPCSKVFFSFMRFRGLINMLAYWCAAK